MKLVAIMPARNEGCHLPVTVPALLQWVDELVILDHASTDGSVSGFGERVHVMRENDPTWFEMSHRQKLLEAARVIGATHIVTVDADEILSADSVEGIKDEIKGLKPGEVLQPFWAHLWRGFDKYRTDGAWTGKVASSAFRDMPGLCWQTRDGYDHHHREPFGATGFRRGSGTLMHLQHVSWRHLLAKQCWYKMTERVRWPERETAAQVDRKYHATVDESGLFLGRAPAEWTAGYDLSGINYDAQPWQVAECRQMLDVYGEERFVGIQRYGVC